MSGTIHAIDITSLLTPLSEARVVLGFSAFSYSGVATPAVGQPILAAQFQQIREALR